MYGLAKWGVNVRVWLAFCVAASSLLLSACAESGQALVASRRPLFVDQAVFNKELQVYSMEGEGVRLPCGESENPEQSACAEVGAARPGQ